jgi:hypothetical protein
MKQCNKRRKPIQLSPSPCGEGSGERLNRDRTRKDRPHAKRLLRPPRCTRRLVRCVPRARDSVSPERGTACPPSEGRCVPRARDDVSPERGTVCPPKGVQRVLRREYSVYSEGSTACTPKGVQCVLRRATTVESEGRPRWNPRGVPWRLSQKRVLPRLTRDSPENGQRLSGDCGSN